MNQEKTQQNILAGFRQLIKLYDGLQKDLREKYSLTPTESNVINFLHNNPGKDTAADIVELRGIPKGNVSQAVEALIQKSCLSRRQDPEDRRRIHLSLTEETAEIVKEIEMCKKYYNQVVFRGLSPEEIELYKSLNSRIMQNAKEELERIVK